jgi:hypothetical protein
MKIEEDLSVATESVSVSVSVAETICLLAPLCFDTLDQRDWDVVLQRVAVRP